MEKKIIELREQAAKLGPGKEKVDLMNELSWSLRYERGTEGADIASSAIEMATSLAYKKGLAYAQLNLAANRYLADNDQDVDALLLDALDYFNKYHVAEVGRSRVNNLLAMVHDSFGDYETALVHAQNAIDAAIEAGDKEGEGDAYASMGLIHNRLCDFIPSLSEFNKSLEIRKQLKNERAVASSLNLIARTHALSRNYDLAMSFYQQSLDLRERIHDSGGLPWTYLGMASLQEKKENHEEAIVLYKKVLKLNKEHYEKRMDFLGKMGVGKSYLALGEMEKSEKYLQEAYKLAGDIGSRPLMADVLLALSSLSEKQGDLKKSLKHLKRYHEIDKEVNDLEARNRLKNQQIYFATKQSKKEAEISHLRNVELKAAFDEIDEKNQEITASIKYAEKIQQAVFPPEANISEILSDHFVLFLPRDIVSGDYYWATKKEGKIVFTAADCTGHGIPGAFMSMLGVAYLNEIVNTMPTLEAGNILNELRRHIIESLHQEGKEGEQKDGMDMGLCVYDPEKQELQYSGAYNSMYLMRKGELLEYKADRMPVAIHFHADKAFTNHIIELEKGDVVYLFSDGYPDQFGGEDEKKFKYKQLKELLLKVHKKPMSDQKEILHKRFEEWKGDTMQIDDVVILGVRF